MTRPNKAKITYDREELVSSLSRKLMLPSSAIDAALAHYEARRRMGKDQACQAVVHHGPGHQSSAYCQATGGPDGHDRRDGVLVHFAVTDSLEHVEWTDDRPYAEYWG